MASPPGWRLQCCLFLFFTLLLLGVQYKCLPVRPTWHVQSDMQDGAAIDFEWCKPDSVAPDPPPEPVPGLPAFRIRLGAATGGCSTLIGILDAVMYAMQQQRSYFLDENITVLKGNRTHWFSFFFDPIGAEFTEPFADIFYGQDVLRFARNATITLGNQTMRKLDMKRTYIRRLWHFQPWVREKVCQLVQGLSLRHPFVSMLIRLGDKQTVENREIAPLATYVDALQAVTLNGFVRRVFVATDDCRVLESLAEMAPMYTFASLCHVDFGKGFVLSAKRDANLDQHFLKFFGELVAMAEADTFIGDRQSNVYHWVAYMRRPSSSNISLIDIRQHPYMSGTVM